MTPRPDLNREKQLGRWTRVRSVALWVGFATMAVCVLEAVLIALRRLDVRVLALTMIVFVVCRVVRTHAETRLTRLGEQPESA